MEIVCINTIISDDLDDRAKTLRINREKSCILLEKLNKVKGLTIGKTYKVIASQWMNDGEIFYYICDDNNNQSKFSSERFKNLEDVRTEKLIKLGI